MRGFLVLLLLIGLGAGGWWGYHHYFGAAPPVEYRFAEVKRGDLVATVSATGTIEPVVKVLVGSQVSGTIIKWFADFNDSVRADQILVELDQDRFRAALEQRAAALAVAEARVAEAQARLKMSSLERARLEHAMARQAASDFEVESARAAEAQNEAAVAAAEAQVLAARAEKYQAEIELSKTVIRSPIDGVVISRDIDEGQTVAASLQAPTLFTIANDLTKMRVNAAVSENDIGRIREGMEAQFRVDAFPGRRFRGVVSQVRFHETVVDNVVTYTTMIDVENDDLSLRPGMTATVLFEVSKAEQVLFVPNAALRFDPGAVVVSSDPMRPGRGQAMRSRVFRVDGGNGLVEISIEPGLTDGSSTEIVRGDLKEGDQIVVEQLAWGVRASNSNGPPMGPGAGARRGPRGM